MKKTLGKVLSVLIVISLILSQMAMLSFAAEPEIVSLTAVAQNDLIENYNGWYTTDEIWDEELQTSIETEEYFYYSVDDSDFDYVVTLKDGSTIEGDTWVIGNAIGYQPYVETNQSYDNQWSLGKNEVEISLMDVTTTAAVEVVENPVASISAVAQNELIENYNGCYTTDLIWDEELQTDIETEEYFYYSVDDIYFDYVVTLKDGSTIEGNAWKIYEAIGYWPQTETNQSYENQWGVGKHEVEISLIGVTTTVEVEVVETPVENMTITPVRDLISGIDNSGYSEYLDFNVDIKFKDGTTDKCLASDLGYKYGYYFEMVESEDAIGVGRFNFIGYEGEYELKFIENPYESIEISGTEELTIKFNRLDGTSETAKAIDYDWRLGDVGINGGYIITDKGAYPAVMRYLFDEYKGTEYPNKDITFVIGEMESNTLETNNWYLTLSKSKDYFREIGYYKGLSGDKFSGIDATSANANVTDLIGIAIQILQYEYEWEWVEEIVDGWYYCYGIYNVDDVVEMVDRVFGISNVDYTKHPGYNSEDGTIKVPEIAGYGGDGEFVKISYNEVFENGKWTITQTFYSYNDATVTTTLILNEKGQIEKISYFKDIAGWTLEHGKWAYYENGVKVTNRWLKDSAGWCYVGDDGYCVTNQWVKDSHGWCYLDSNGRMATNKWIKDSVGWCYVGADGYCVTNKWVKDSHGWCYLDSNGRMATNKWIKDSVGWCYVGADGYCVTNKWVKDSHGWCYLDSNGRMATNKWIRDSVGWCYVGADGYCVTNAWKADSKGWCYLDAQGRMMTNSWLQWNGNWYYLDGNGYMVTGTKVINGKTYKFASNGVWIG